MDTPTAKSPDVQFLASNHLDNSLIVSVNFVRYEYYIEENFTQVEAVFKGLLKKGAPGRALNWLKSRSKQYELL